MRNHLTTASELIGIALFIAGTALIWVPLALLVAGAALVGIGYLLGRDTE